MKSPMTPDQEAYIRYRLSRAEDTLGEARVLLMQKCLYGTVNRLYYACFYAVEALLRTEGLSSRRHSGVLALMDKHWAKEGRIPSDMSDFYHEVYDRRHAGDYAAFVTFRQDKVEQWLQKAEELVRCVSSLAIKALPEQH